MRDAGSGMLGARPRRMMKTIDTQELETVGGGYFGQWGPQPSPMYRPPGGDFWRRPPGDFWHRPPADIWGRPPGDLWRRPPENRWGGWPFWR